MSDALDPRAIVSIMGGNVTGRDSCNVPGPGHSKADESLSIKVNARAPGGFIVFSHASDNPMECRDYVRDRLGLEPWKTGNQDRRKQFVVINQKPDEKEKMRRVALDIWQQSASPAESIVAHYLREHRGLTLDDVSGDVIRFHGSLYFDAQARLPGMVCLLRNIFTDEPCGIHRTFLDRQTGQKIDRKMLGIAKEAAIKFDPQANIASRLTIGEGVETVLSARMVGYLPAWALGSSGAVRTFPTLAELAEITILEENDPTSRRDVKACAKRYLSARKPVNIVTSHVGNDMNDAWMAMK
jgi:putative DNA primase/helicase